MLRRFVPRAFVIGLVLLPGLAGAACGGGKTHPATAESGLGAALYAACDLHADCASELCTFELYASDEDGVCTRECESDDDCADAANDDAACREMPAIHEPGADAGPSLRVRACVLPCTESAAQVYECRDGERLFCGDAAETACDVCNCSEGSFCDPESNRCRRYVHGGEACGADLECLSQRCDDGACASGQGDACDETCGGSCGGPPEALYCMPACVDAPEDSEGRRAPRCPVDERNWECLTPADDPAVKLCSRVCNTDEDCIGEGDICEMIGRVPGEDWPFYFDGLCRQPVEGESP